MRRFDLVVERAEDVGDGALLLQWWQRQRLSSEGISG